VDGKGRPIADARVYVAGYESEGLPQKTEEILNYGSCRLESTGVATCRRSWSPCHPTLAPAGDMPAVLRLENNEEKSSGILCLSSLLLTWFLPTDSSSLKKAFSKFTSETRPVAQRGESRSVVINVAQHR